MEPIGIGIDLGGSFIKAVAIDGSGNILQKEEQISHDGHENSWKESVMHTVKKLKGKFGDQQFGIGLAAPGLPDEKNSVIAHLPERLRGLINLNWTDLLGMKTWVVNDALAAMLAEARFGSAKGMRNVVMLTLGTGVGGAILINGELYQGKFQKAGHFGHMVINDEAAPDICGMPGSLEDAIGNATIGERSNGRFSSTQDLLKAYRKDDAFAKEVWLLSVKKLAIGLASITNILSPELIVIGGGIAEAGKDLFEPLEEYISNYEWRAGGRVKITRAKHQELAGAIGAACFALEKQLNN